jgi:hypothetical protein
VKAAISIAVRAPMEREGQELPAYFAQAKSKKMQAMRADGSLGIMGLDGIDALILEGYVLQQTLLCNEPNFTNTD